MTFLRVAGLLLIWTTIGFRWEEEDDIEAECLDATDCTGGGIEGSCDDGQCFYDAHELNLGDEEWPQCIEGCAKYFGNFFQSPSMDGTCADGGILCNFWKNLLSAVVAEEGESNGESEWKRLMGSLVDDAGLLPIPGLHPGKTVTDAVENCYCSRLCEMGTAADFGSDDAFWTRLKAQAESQTPGENQMAMMEMVHARFEGDACRDVLTISLPAVVGFVLPAAEASSFLEVSGNVSNSQAQGFFNPLNCFNHIRFGKTRAAGLAHEVMRNQNFRGSWGRRILAFATKHQRSAARALKGVDGWAGGASRAFGNFFEKLNKMRALGGGRNVNIKGVNGVGVMFADVLNAVGIVLDIASGNPLAAATKGVAAGITKIAGGSLISLLGATGGGAVAVGIVASIGVNVVVCTAVGMLTGAGGASATAAGFLGALKNACK